MDYLARINWEKVVIFLLAGCFYNQLSSIASSLKCILCTLRSK